MSEILEVIVGTIPEQAGGFAELLVHWGGEAHSADPRTLGFVSVRLALRPVASHIRARFSDVLPTGARALVVDEQLVLHWKSGRVSPEEMASLRGVFAELANQMSYAVVVEGELGTSTTVVRLPAGQVYQYVDDLYRGDDALGLRLVLVDKG